MTAAKVLIDNGLAISVSQAKRLIMQGAVKLNNQPVNWSDDLQVKDGDLLACGKNTATIQIGEYYADYDEDSAMWCVFHTDKKSGFAYASYASEELATDDANRRNGK